MPAGTKGLITRIIGPVVDVTFPRADETPELFNSLEVETKGGKLVLEVLQQLGNGIVRCISMHATDGLSRGMFATDTGDPITIPVGEETLGRMLNVNGDPIDRMGEVAAKQRHPIHRSAPPFTEIVPGGELLETGIKVIDLMTPTPRGARSASSAAPGWARPCSSWSSSATSHSSMTATASSPAWASAPGRATTFGRR